LAQQQQQQQQQQQLEPYSVKDTVRKIMNSDAFSNFDVARTSSPGANRRVVEVRLLAKFFQNNQ